jgi:hypothetical protein
MTGRRGRLAHYDERNAQWLIMAAQKHFIDQGPPPDTVLYFIPCLSPTMCFADARGIPIVDENGNKLSIPDALNRVTIPYLHNLIASLVPKSLDAPDDKELLRELIKDQLDPTNPQYGIDANRDVNFSLDSSRRFAEFIESVTGIDLKQTDKKDDGRCTVFMIHGYDSSKANYIENQGCVYGQYKPYAENPSRGVIPAEILRYIDMMTQSLFGYINAASSRVATDDTGIREYFYKNDNGINKFNGEWIRHLYGKMGERNILAFDIELGQAYNEQVRGDRAALTYDPDKVGNEYLEFFKPKREPEQPGFFVPSAVSFYSFLTSFYDRKKDADEAE